MEFECTIGAYRGDALSGCLFTLCSAGALYHLRAVSTTIRPNPPYTEECLPTEWEYADDEEFLSEDRVVLDQLLKLCRDVFAEWNLKVNEDKTEFTKLYLVEKDEREEKGELVKGREEWRSSKTLGSKLCTKVDITHRCNRGHQAFESFKKVWLQGTKISLSRRLMVYNKQVTSVIMYNCNSWAPTNESMNELDVYQRKHLRQILKMQWPTGRSSR